MRRLVALAVLIALLVAFVPLASGFGGVSFEGDETDTFNENTDETPPGCDRIAGEQDVEVAAVSGGTGYPLFEYQPTVIETEPCTRLTVTFSSQTRIRHQFVVRGLPQETYPSGYFGIEADGGSEEAATFVTPSEDTTLPFESTVGSQAKSGLRGQVVVGEGDGDVEGVPGVTKHGWEEDGDTVPLREGASALVGVAVGVLTAAVLSRFRGR